MTLGVYIKNSICNVFTAVEYPNSILLPDAYNNQFVSRRSPFRLIPLSQGTEEFGSIKRLTRWCPTGCPFWARLSLLSLSIWHTLFT